MAPIAQTIPVNFDSKEEAPSFPFVIETREQLQNAAEVIAEKQIQLATLQTKQATVLSRIQARYAKPIGELNTAIAEQLDAAHAWCLKHEATEFADSKTIGFPLAEVQFKTCPPSVRELPGWTAANIVKAFKRWTGLKYLRVKIELDKQAILRDRETKKPFVWARRGVQIAQARSLTITSTTAPVKASLTR